MKYEFDYEGFDRDLAATEKMLRDAGMELETPETVTTTLDGLEKAMEEANKSGKKTIITIDSWAEGVL